MASINSSSLLTPPCFDILKTPPPTTLNDTDLLVQDIIETPPHYQCGYPRCTLSFPTRAALSQHTINLHTESYGTTMKAHPLYECAIRCGNVCPLARLSRSWGVTTRSGLPFCHVCGNVFTEWHSMEMHCWDVHAGFGIRPCCPPLLSE